LKLSCSPTGKETIFQLILSPALGNMEALAGNAAPGVKAGSSRNMSVWRITEWQL
jgi:hypothetical protein